MKINYTILLFILLLPNVCLSQKLIPVADGWANNSVNVTIFRKNSLVTHNNVQFIAFYDTESNVVLGKRKIKSNEWILNKTQYKGNSADAHNSISIMVDGEGYLHVSWDHHGNPLRYAKGISPYSLELTEKKTMTGKLETNVTYPEFHKLPNGDIIFMYRDGQSGRGNLVLNYYHTKSKRWEQLQNNLIDGQGQRNAYWQACVDRKGIIHLSWVWRETWDVSTNHDICYARSADGGKTWVNSKNEKYILPINAETAEYALHIPQNSELINQTSMTTDEKGNPYIASYWREQDSQIPQYRIVYYNGNQWQNLNLSFRKTPFSLKGGGTKRIPVSRPQILVRKGMIHLIFRDEERGEKVSVASNRIGNTSLWDITDLSELNVGAWEPTYDTELWLKKGLLHLFVQKVTQIDGEGKANASPEKIYVLEATIK